MTSCNRHDLLRRTLDSFIQLGCGGLKPDACVIVEDGPTAMPEWLRENIHYYSANLGKVSWIQNEARRGQVYSIDRAYEAVRTDYIFHCEDDWLFVRGDFMQESKRILERYANISMVALRGDSCNGHTIIDWPGFEGFKIQMPFWQGCWGGLSWNPGLRRLSDWRQHGGFGGRVTYGEGGLAPEKAISQLYLERGFRIAANPTHDNTPYVQHIGHERSRSVEATGFVVPKVLIAIPACHEYSYGAWDSEASPSYDESRAWQGRPYGSDIHISGLNDRIAAVRETWMRDTAAWPTVSAKFFYGNKLSATRAPGEDEVFLDCLDDYEHLPNKTVAICRWAIEQDFDFLLKVDDDTGVYVERVIRELLSKHFDYAGCAHHGLCTGGPGYWLSKRAMRAVVAGGCGDHWAEDVTVGKRLTDANIYAINLSGHHSGRADHWYFANGFDETRDMSDVTTFHAVRPADMRAWHAHKQGTIK